jgi:MYXO-CTERM domain-containing protein
VFVLTIPSFRWIRANTRDDFETDAANNIGRAHHRCVAYKDAQMIVIGGAVRNGSQKTDDGTSCRPRYPPIRVLDTTTYAWKTMFDPSVTYRVPYVVTDVIGGNASGHAELMEPESGFNFTALNTVFSQLALPAATKTSTNPSSPSTTDTSAPSPHLSSHSHTGAVAGGALGGVVAILALLALIHFLSRSRRRKAQSCPLFQRNFQARESPPGTEQDLSGAQQLEWPKIPELDSDSNGYRVLEGQKVFPLHSVHTLELRGSSRLATEMDASTGRQLTEA